MAVLAVTNTFVDGNTITAAGHNTNFSDIVVYVNARNDGSATWDAIRATTSSAVVAIFNNSSGSSNIMNLQDNGTNVMTVGDGGAVVITATAGGSSVPLTINNNNSTGSIFIAQDAGSAIMTIADGGALTYDGAAVFNEAGADKDFRIEGDTNANLVFVDASADAVGFGHNAPTATIHVAGGSGTIVAARINNGTSTGNILEAEDNGTDALILADGGVLTLPLQPSSSAFSTGQTILDNTLTKVQYGTERYDAASNYDNSVNYRFTAPVAGRYLVTARVIWGDTAAGAYHLLAICKSGATLAEAIATTFETWAGTGTADTTDQLTTIVTMAVNDYLEVNVQQNSGGSIALLNETTSSTSGLNTFEVAKIN